MFEKTVFTSKHPESHLEVNAAAVVCVVFGEDLVDEGLGLGIGENVDIHV